MSNHTAQLVELPQWMADRIAELAIKSSVGYKNNINPETVFNFALLAGIHTIEEDLRKSQFSKVTLKNTQRQAEYVG